MLWAAKSDVGRRRDNEDAWGAFPDAGVWCVADGMGGAEGGEIASRAVVTALGHDLRGWSGVNPALAIEDRADLIARSLNRVSTWILSWASEHGVIGTGTTFVGFVLDPSIPSAPLALHAGDSRLYRLRGRRLTPITRDHSAAGLTGVSEEFIAPALRNLVLRAVGVHTTVELERTPFELAPADRLLLCTDGLYRSVPERDIAHILRSAADPASAAHALVAEANIRGGSDNITVLALFAPDPLPPPVPIRPRLSEEERDRLEADDLENPETDETTTTTLPHGEKTQATQEFPT